MNRDLYFDGIKRDLLFLVMSIEAGGKLNLLNGHVHSENFYVYLFNLIFDYKLENLNTQQQNIGGIDLVDNTNKIIIQVSSTATKSKIESALDKVPSIYHKHKFQFIPIVFDASKLNKIKPLNPHKIAFNPKSDIFDVNRLLNIIMPMHIDKLKDIYELLNKELVRPADPLKIDSELANVIQLLSRENLTLVSPNQDPLPFEIEEKIQYNKLIKTRAYIDDYFIYQTKIESLYTEFDKQATNKSLYVTGKFKSIYVATDSTLSPDIRFDTVIRQAIDFIKASANYKSTSSEELELCVQILAVDAFIRCKIFEKPPRKPLANP